MILIAVLSLPILATTLILYTLFDSQLTNEARIQAETAHAQINHTFQEFHHLIAEDEQKLDKHLSHALDELAMNIARTGKPITSFMPSELQALARTYDVDDIYLLDNTMMVVATNYTPDLSLRLSDISQGLALTLQNLYNNKDKRIGRVNISTRTNVIKKYGYYAPANTDYLVEVAVDVPKYISLQRGQTYANYLFDELFNRYTEESNYLKRVDLYRVNALKALPFFADAPALPESVLLKLQNQNLLMEATGPYLEVYSRRPVDIDNLGQSEYWVIHSSFNREAFLAARDQTIRVNLAVYIVSSLLGALIFAGLLSQRFTQKLNHISRALENITAGQYNQIIPVSGHDELDRIARDINTMQRLISEREELLEQTNQILEQKISERTTELNYAKEAAETANTLKSQFLANMSHELRTPMNAIIGFCQLALDDDLQPSPKNRIKKALQAARNLLGLLNDILDFSKIEADRLELEQIPFTLNGTIQEVLDVVDQQIVDKGLTLSIDTASDIPLFLRGDPLRLNQILLNLINNAVKFTDHGGLFLRIENLGVTNDRCRLRFTVKDTGIGLRPEQIGFLFKPFNQADTSISRLHGGTGLGLAICARLTQMMGGDIGVDSEYGKGSTFWFCMEVGVIQTVSAEELPTAAPLLMTTAHRFDEYTKTLKGKRVLLVEDNFLNQELAITLLHRVGIEVELASNGQEAVNMVEPGRYDVILMDCQMPVMDGYEASRHLRSRSELSRLPIIALTAHALMSDKEKCKEAGMDDYLSKPIEAIKLFTTLIQWLSEKPEHTPIHKQNPVRPSEREPLTGTLDKTAALEALDNDTTLYDSLVGLFILQESDFMDRFNEATQHGDYPTALRHAHSLKSSAAILGAFDLQNLANQLEHACMQEDKNLIDPGGIEPIILALKPELSAVLAKLETLASSA